MMTTFENVFKTNTAKIYPEYEYKLNFDGCSKGNPGMAGAGAVLYKNGEEIWFNTIYIGENYTNNHAEYAGLILGLTEANARNIKHLKVEGDSLLVVNHMKGIYACRSKNLIYLYDKAKSLSKLFERIEFNHVLRHYNKRADELSNIALQNHLDQSKYIT
jgi:ribonuclease HI